MNNLQRLLIKHEGFVKRPYEDTLGNISIGVGRNLDGMGLTDEEVMFLLNNDIARCDVELLNNFEWYADLSRCRQDAMINMCFNLGITKLKKFYKALSAMKEGNYELAADEFLDSKWARQVGNRAIEVTDMIRQGRY